MYKYRKPLLIVASAMALIPIVYAAMAAVFTIVSGLHGVATCDEMSPFTMWTCSNFIWFAVRTALLSGMSYGLVRAFTSVKHWRRYWRSSYHGWWITYRVQLYLVKRRIRHGQLLNPCYLALPKEELPPVSAASYKTAIALQPRKRHPHGHQLFA